MLRIFDRCRQQTPSTRQRVLNLVPYLGDKRLAHNVFKLLKYHAFLLN